MAAFNWNIPEDTLEYDEMMKHLLQGILPIKNVRESFLKARLIHPKDRQEFQNHVGKILHMKSQRRDPFQDMSIDFRISYVLQNQI